MKWDHYVYRLQPTLFLQQIQVWMGIEGEVNKERDDEREKNLPVEQRRNAKLVTSRAQLIATVKEQRAKSVSADTGA